MSEIIREFGLDHAAKMQELIRSMGVERVEVTGENYSLINNDCVEETMRMADGSVDMVLTSIPFSTQYEYTPSYNDFGHTDDNEHFFAQMDFLTPELLRILEPGRIAAIHVKDRIVPGGMTGLGFQTVYPFHCRTIEHYVKHGFAYMGMKTIVTDVVRENNQTYRLGWTEQCKDGTKMGVGMPEYLLLFRKPPSESINSYADVPVVKQKAEYSRARWQTDAHGFARSDGNRLLRPEELDALDHQAIFKLFRDYNLENVYNFEQHVQIGEALEKKRILPVTFMLLQTPSWSPDVWTDVTRMQTLNGLQYAKGKEMHLCPMQFDIADRAIAQHTNPGDTVFDPFGGLMTTPYRALKLGRKAIATELNHRYFLDGCMYAKAMEEKMAMPTLFDTLEDHIVQPHEMVAGEGMESVA
jgi:DNA modification methylase